MEDHLSVICGTDKGCTQGQVISIEDFQRQRFLLREKGSGTREVFNRVVEQAGIHITPVSIRFCPSIKRMKMKQVVSSSNPIEVSTLAASSRSWTESVPSSLS